MKKNIVTFCLIVFVAIACKDKSTGSDPDPIELNFQLTHVTAYNGSDGSIDLTVSGGKPPFTFLWSNGAATEDIQNIAGGIYWVEVTDDNNQTVTDTVTVLQPPHCVQLTFDTEIDICPDWSADGSKIAFHSNRGGNRDIWFITVPDNQLTQVTHTSIDEYDPSFSPNGSEIVFYTYNSINNGDIWTCSIDGSNRIQRTSGPHQDESPAWSPDGTSISFCSNRNTEFHLYNLLISNNSIEQITSGSQFSSEPRWSGNNNSLVHSRRTGNNIDIWTISADGSNAVRLTTHSAYDAGACWSEDNSKIAFHSNRTGNSEIWIMDSDGSNLIQVTRNSAEDLFPCFSPDGSQIVFASNRSGNFDIWILDLE